MLKYILLKLQRQPRQNILTSGGFLIIACAFILLNTTIQTTVLQTGQIISQNWRPTYDLIVLPPHTSVPISKAIPPDKFENYDGGISIQQYQQIKKLTGVEVAAPIAFVSYASFPTSTIQFGSQSSLPGFYQLDWTLNAFNGKQQITEYHSSVRTYASPASCKEVLCEPNISSNQQNALNSIGVNDYFFTKNGGYFTGVPNPGTFLLAAVDPEAENQLVHLNKSIVTGNSLSQQDTLDLNADQPDVTGSTIDEKVPNYNVPVLINKQLSGQITLHASLVRLATNVTEPQEVIAHGGSAYLDRLPQKVVFKGNVPIAQNDLRVFSKGAQLVQSYNYQTIFYTIYNGSAYAAKPIGEFDGNNLSAEFANTLNWLPENTYTSSPTALRYDAEGHSIKGTNLLPTTNPAGFMLQSPLALTTLAAAKHIRGENCINVIRVRVAGKITSDDNGWKRVTQVAQLIQQRTGLKAIVTLGSSPKPTLVYIPGLNSNQSSILQNIAPIGWIEERWIFIGAGVIYLKQSNETQLLLLSSVLLVCFGYLIVTLSSLVSTQRRELAVLSALGWRPGNATILFLSQALLLALGGGIGGITLALLIVSLIGASPPWQIVAWTLPVLLALALISAAYPLWQIEHIQPAEVLRAGSVVSSERKAGRMARLVTRLPVMSSFAFRNLARARMRSFIQILSGDP